MDDSRLYAKTNRAWEALARPDVVGRQAHTLLLMANGRRNLSELSLLLGEDVSSLARSLQESGYLHHTASAAIRARDDDTLTDA